MLLVWLLWVVGVGAGPAPSTTLQDDHQYYTMSVFQNNAGNSFDQNFVDMENADVKHGEIIVLFYSRLHKNGPFCSFL